MIKDFIYPKQNNFFYERKLLFYNRWICSLEGTFHRLDALQKNVLK